MSRDWTPRETYLVEQHDLKTKTGMGSIWDFMENAAWVIDGKSFPLHTPEAVALRKQYPVLGKFLESFEDLYYKLSQFEGGLDLLKQKDAELAAYIDSGEGDKSSYLVKWFEGELDGHFYYRERNDELLVSEICNEAITRGLKNWIVTDPDCAQVCRQTGFEGHGVFELIQIEKCPADASDAEAAFIVAEGEIDFNNFTQEEINSALESYGYDNMKALIRAASSENEAYGQLAEMLFELSICFYTIRFDVWDEALNYISNKIGLDLSACRDQGKPPLEEQIVKCAAQTKAHDPGTRDADKEGWFKENSLF